MDLLNRVLQLEQDAEAFGFSWGSAQQIMEQIHSECAEIQEHLNQSPDDDKALQEEIGDLLHAVFSLSIFCQFEPKNTLQKTLIKFERRLNAVKELALNEGLLDLKGHSFDELMKFWNQAKLQVG